MAPPLPASNSSAFLAMPLEIRQHIYRLCIPHHLNFHCCDNLDSQNRPPGWAQPQSRIYTSSSGNYFHCLPDDLEICSSEDADSDEVTEVDEYEPSRLDDYSRKSKRHRPSFSPVCRSALPGLLLACRQINDEVQAILYGENTFTVDCRDEPEWHLERFRPETRKQMRKMILILRPVPGFRMAPKIWDGALSGLSILGVIIQQPDTGMWDLDLEIARFSAEVGMEPVLEDEWPAWLTLHFEHLARVLPKTTEIVVDANKNEDTVRLLEKTLPGRCRFQRLRAADLIFKRGEFAPELDDMEYFYDDGPTSCRDIIDDCDYDLYYSD